MKCKAIILTIAITATAFTLTACNASASSDNIGEVLAGTVEPTIETQLETEAEQTEEATQETEQAEADILDELEAEENTQEAEETEIGDTIYELNDITIRYPTHWTAERSERAQGYAVEFFNPEIDKTIRHYTNAEIIVEKDIEIGTAQQWLDTKKAEQNNIFDFHEYSIIDIDGVEAAHLKAHPDGDIYRVYELIIIPYNDTLYTIQLIHSAGWKKELDIFSEMLNSITIK